MCSNSLFYGKTESVGESHVIESFCEYDGTGWQCFRLYARSQSAS